MNYEKYFEKYLIDDSSWPFVLNEDEIIMSWNHLWWILEYFDHNGELVIKLIKDIRIDSPRTAFQVLITKEQLNSLVEKLNLIGFIMPYKKHKVWKNEVAWKYFGNYAIKKWERRKPKN